jgi:CBS domain-containing protein
MTRDVRTVTPDTPLARAAELLVEHKIGCLPVLDADDRLIGIVTESDFVRLAARLLA